jgi:transposase
MDTRTAILKLREAGHGIKAIARVLKVTRKTVRRVLDSGASEVPKLQRDEKAEPHADLIRQLNASCESNLVRVQEELDAAGIVIPYSTLTGFCRRHEIGVKKKKRSGRYHFDMGEEMQHDTSPHDVKVGGKLRRLQCASVVLCFCRMIFIQVYETFNRFLCKVFLTEALKYFGGAAERCMLDNSSVVIAHGTGRNAVPAPEMEAFGDRFDFKFAAHEKGDANRSARVEAPFWFVERNFYPGRTFRDLKDLNLQAVQWCDKSNRKFKKHIQAVPLELYQLEKPHLKPLPIYIPEVYELHHRVVDLEGYVNVHTNRYSVPEELLCRSVEVRESKDLVRIFSGHRLMAEHERQEWRARQRMTLPEHRFSGRWKKKGSPLPPLVEEKTLSSAGEVLASMVTKLRKRHGGRAARQIKKLHRMYIEYPTDALCKAVEEALAYGLFDLDRIERIVLRNVAGDFFQLPLGVKHEKKEDRQEETKAEEVDQADQKEAEGDKGGGKGSGDDSDRK